jgi:hypothetical protein
MMEGMFAASASIASMLAVLLAHASRPELEQKHRRV